MIKLSKTLSHALRHAPEAYGLKVDNEGWVNLSDLTASLQEKGWKDIKEEDVKSLIEKSEKKRFQVLDNRIRAYYGHSLKEKILKKTQAPPNILYHGTTTDILNSIKIKGLLPMDRQYVHLSEDMATAKIVAERRKHKETIILVVLALQAYDGGISFYREENAIWLSESIPTQYIKL